MAGDPLEKIGSFFYHSKRLRYKKGEVLIRADDIPPGVFYLHKGYVRIYSLSETGQELTQIIFKPHDFFPLIWAVNNSVNTQYCEALTNIEVARVTQDEFVQFLRENPDVLEEVLHRVLTREEGLLERMQYLIFGNAYQKVASILVICVERFGKEKDGMIRIKVPLTHKDIASLVGLTRETTSVEIKKLENLKLIGKKGKFLNVYDLKKLKTEAQWYKFV